MSEKVERLVNLTVALLETRRPLTFRELRDRTGYYAHRDAESARRMFERDKDDLRQLGVPIETRTDPFETEPGYIVDRRTYELPDVDLDADEVAALALALQVAGDQRSRLGLSKLVARAPDPTDLDAPAPVRISLDVDPVEAVADAVVQRRTVRFPYRSGSGTGSQRTVDPYAVVQRRGSWYLVGRDHDRDGVRAFRLDRVTGKVTATGEPAAFTAPDDLDLATAVAGPTQETVEATVAIAPASRWEAEVRGAIATGAAHDGWPVYRLAGPAWRTASFCRALGAGAEVLGPSEVREAVVAGLRALARGAEDGE